MEVQLYGGPADGQTQHVRAVDDMPVDDWVIIEKLEPVEPLDEYVSIAEFPKYTKVRYHYRLHCRVEVHGLLPDQYRYKFDHVERIPFLDITGEPT